jgi:polyhydroxybutyrate depolymerase
MYTITNGEHGWPGTTDPTRFGDTTDAISATDLIWEFFVAHPRE